MLDVNIVALFQAKEQTKGVDNLLNCISRQHYLKIKHVS